MNNRVGTSPAPPLSQRPTVVFLDRDGTIIRDAHYLARPEQVELLPGAAEAIAQLNRAQIPVIVITNQSGIARGYFTVQDYERAHAHFIALLAERGARVDASYYCPHHPDVGGACECRKPGAALFRQAIAEHHLDSSGAVAIGDRWRDLAPVIQLGGRGILTPSPMTPEEDLERARQGATVLPSLSAAVDFLVPLQTAPHASQRTA